MPQSTHSLFLIAARLLLAGVLDVANAQQAPAEADSVSRDLLRHESWLADSQKCPTEVMAEKESPDPTKGNDCKPGNFASCLSRCAANDAGACYWLGNELQQAHASPAASELLYQRSCKLGVVSGCTNRAAGMLEEHPKDSRIQACATATFKRTCSLDDPWGCTMYALHLSRGIGVAQDRGLALTVLEKSCKYGADDPACSYGVQLRNEIQAKRGPGLRDK